MKRKKTFDLAIQFLSISALFLFVLLILSIFLYKSFSFSRCISDSVSVFVSVYLSEFVFVSHNLFFSLFRYLIFLFINIVLYLWIRAYVLLLGFSVRVNLYYIKQIANSYFEIYLPFSLSFTLWPGDKEPRYILLWTQNWPQICTASA